MIKNARLKQRLLEALKESPFIESACKKVGIARATYYRWRNADKQFAWKCEQAIAEGTSVICDIAESKIFEMIREGDKWAIALFLKHNRRKYQIVHPQDEAHQAVWSPCGGNRYFFEPPAPMSWATEEDISQAKHSGSSSPSSTVQDAEPLPPTLYITTQDEIPVVDTCMGTIR
jgi:hypothetical protein